MPNTRTAVAAREAAAPPATNVAEQRTEMLPHKPTPEEIAEEAYAIHRTNGSQHGRDVDDWLEAERRLTSRTADVPAQEQHASLQAGDHDTRQTEGEGHGLLREKSIGIPT